MANCENCNNQFSENYCPNCGQISKLKRIDKHYLTHEFLHLLHFEKGFPYTVKELLSRPGDSIKEFIEKNRNKHMKPVPFLILTSLLCALVLNITHANDIQNDQGQLLFGNSKINDILHWMQGHRGYANIMQGVFTALSVKLFFRKYKYNFFEIIILMCFVIGQATLLLALVTLFYGTMNQQLYTIISGIVNLGYSVWAIGQFFYGTKLIGYVKALLAIMFGFIISNVTIVLVGSVADLIIKMLNNH